MSDKRTSSRPSTVKKSLLLEEKLALRKEKAEVRRQRSRSLNLERLHKEELSAYAADARLLSDLVSSDSETPTDPSLEWDSDIETTSPSFVKEPVDYQRTGIEEDIIKGSSQSPGLSAGVARRRRNTSTDGEFLEEFSSSDVVGSNVLNWPPREPSQEPENSILDNYFSLLKPLSRVSSVREVSDGSSSPLSMEAEIYNTKLRAVKLAEISVKDEMQTFTVDDVTVINCATCQARFQDVRNELKSFNKTVADVILDLDEENSTDEERKRSLESRKSNLLNLVKNYEREIENKVKELCEAQPLSVVESRQMENVSATAETAKVEKKKKIDNAITHISRKIADLQAKLDIIKAASEVSDNDVRQVLSEFQTLDRKIDEIDKMKIRFDDNIIGVDVDQEAVDELNTKYDDLCKEFKEKYTDYCKANQDRSLYALSKPVKEVAAYPAPFSGKAGENIHIFKEKFINAIASNQVRERDKLEVLRKYLRGDPRNIVGDDVKTKTIDQAFKKLVDEYGIPSRTWTVIIEDFKLKCKNPKGWSELGSMVRKDLFGRTLDYIEKAISYSKEYNQLSHIIEHPTTTEALVQVLPRETQKKVLEITQQSEKVNMECLENIKELLQREYKMAVEESKYASAMKENSVQFNNACSSCSEIACHNIDSKDKSQSWKKKSLDNDGHDCRKSQHCKEEWFGLGCIKVYQLSTPEERRSYLRGKKCCHSCGRKFHGFGQGKRCKWTTDIEPVRCKPASGQCFNGAATCPRHTKDSQQSSNASDELRRWLDSTNVKHNFNSIFVLPCSAPEDMIHNSVDVSDKVRNKLQSGKMSAWYDNEQLKKLFMNDLEKDGKPAVIKPIPEGEVSFIFCKIKGKRSDVQTFIDCGCNCAIARDGVPQQEFRSCMIRKGPIPIDIATDIKVEARGEWGTLLPLADGSYQAVKCLTVDKVTADMPEMRLRKFLSKVKSENKDHQDINNIASLQVPEVLGGCVDLILGIKFVNVYPELVFSLPNGLQILKSRFLPAKKNEVICIGGPLGALDYIVNSMGDARFSVKYFSYLISSYSKSSPKIDFFPNYVEETKEMMTRYADKDIPGICEFMEDDPESTQNAVVVCNLCNEEIMYEKQSRSVQSELRRFIQLQEAGLDTSFRCIRCRDCRQCLKGAGEERMSMKQEAEQQLIRESVKIDASLGRAVARLPFITDPTDKLTDNTYIAKKRLENVCRKYGSNEEVKEMLNKSMKKLLDNGHIMLLDDLPYDQKEKIMNAKSSYTIPADVAFKEGSVSTPARWVFDAGSKTSTGYSLNCLLAKGTIDLVRLIDMVLDWRCGPSALVGDIRQFYNGVLLSQEHWQYQKILLKENLDVHSKTLTAVVCTLIYGVRPVGNQCEEVIKLLAENISFQYPEAAEMLLKKRYVDDFGKGTKSSDENEKLKRDTSEALGSINMKIKGWAESNKDPPAEMSDDGSSVAFAGMTWFPKGDFYKLNIQSLHFQKKKRGKFPLDMKTYEDIEDQSIDQFTPNTLNRTHCTSVVARIFDIQGLLVPLTLKLKHDLRKLIALDPSWTNPISDEQRYIWVKNFETIEEVRDLLYVRSSIPIDALSPKARILLFSDAADIGIVIGAYACYERPGDVWSCDLLFGKGLLGDENWTIPQKELHGLSALANIKIILENSLQSWVSSFFAFNDSEISLSWVIYEKVKLTTFIRNRVVNIRTKLGLDILHHVEGRENPSDCGTRPSLITANSVQPGSTWLKGKSWMSSSIEKAKEGGIIKHVEDIKLSNENKKKFKDGIVFDTFDIENSDVLAVCNFGKKDESQLEQLGASYYLYPPLKRNFRSVVRIMGFVVFAARKWKSILVKKQISRNEKSFQDLKNLDFKPPIFSVFSSFSSQREVVADEVVQFGQNNVSLSIYFNINGVMLDKPVFDDRSCRTICIDDKHLSAALEYLFSRATAEVKHFNDEKYIQKIAVEHNNILYSKTRLQESAELRIVGHLADYMNLESFTGVNYKVPVLDPKSPLSFSIAHHLHYDKFKHRGAETTYRLSLKFCHIIQGRALLHRITEDCIFCKMKMKKYVEQMMSPLSDYQTCVSPVFYITMVDLWGPIQIYAPGYEKETRSSFKKPYNMYYMVFVCCATGTVNMQVLEGKNTQACLDGFSGFFCDATVPKIILCDAEGGLMKCLKEGVISLRDLSGNLMKNQSVHFETVVPQGHYQHGKVEKKIHQLQESMERANFRNSRCTASGMTTLGKLIAHTVNDTPIGYLFHQSGGANPLLRILSPNNLKLITTGDRAPTGPMTIPDSAADFMDGINQKYLTWYSVWSESYLPLVMQRKKWHFARDNLVPGDVIYFKLTESKMSADWTLGIVDSVKLGSDGYVRKVVVSYKDTSSDNYQDWQHRTVERPVRNVVKLFHVDDTSFMDTIREAYKLAQQILDAKVISNLDNIPCNPDNLVTNSDVDQPLDPHYSQGKPVSNSPSLQPKARKKRKTEVENLEILMKNWNYVSLNPSIQQFTDSCSYGHQHVLEEVTADAAVDGETEGSERCQLDIEGEFENESDNIYNDMINDNPCDFDMYLI